ncbi:LysR family transcriptional regulator [Francisella marina]|uniref:LysR family transcriptional regulator n=1 Tax=Francisella marina TaxID=2249302 RepID=A0ABX5ZI76_9GAMM|nr:LysR family transcriptional regulator [Francisella marina]QEO57704.1 LysR family transcriptional regulator [Francisella marina]QEO60070.1 LysR family transcriptional regulator [Francisella marina]
MSRQVKEVVDKNIIEGTRYFISLVELGSYAAVKSYYSVEVNTIRNKLELLESYLGVKLIQSGSNKVEITKYGKKYYASCHKLYIDLENSILSSKYKGVDKLKYIRIFGTRTFVNYISPAIHEVDPKNEYTFTFDSYLLSQANSYIYQLNNYDIAFIAFKDLDKIDQDHWMVCATIDSVNLPSKIYVNQELLDKYDLKSNPLNVFELPFIMRRDQPSFSLNITVEGKSINQQIKNIKYLVEDDGHKVSLIDKGLGAGVLLDNYAKISNSSIISIDSITTETFYDMQAVIVSKHLRNRTKIIEFLRKQMNNYVSTVLGQ